MHQLKQSALFCILIFQIICIRAQSSGSLKTSFGNDGKLIIPMMGKTETKAMAREPGGKLIVVANAYPGTGSLIRGIAVGRFNSDGSIDSTFNGKGYSMLSLSSEGTASDVAIDAAGRIVVVGNLTATGQGVIGRFLSNGAIDQAFGNGGKVLVQPTAASTVVTANCIAANNSIAICGYQINASGETQGFLQLFTSSGVADNSLNSGNSGSTYFHDNSGGKLSLLNDLYYAPNINSICATGTIKATGGDGDVLYVSKEIGVTAQIAQIDLSGWLHSIASVPTSVHTNDTATHLVPDGPISVICGNTDNLDYPCFVLFLTAAGGAFSPALGYLNTGVIPLGFDNTRARATSIAVSADVINSYVVVAGTMPQEGEGFVCSAKSNGAGYYTWFLSDTLKGGASTSSFSDVISDPWGTSANPGIFLTGTQTYKGGTQCARGTLMRLFERSGYTSSYFGNNGSARFDFGSYASSISKVTHSKSDVNGVSRILAFGISYGNGISTFSNVLALKPNGTTENDFGLDGRVPFQVFSTNGTVCNNAVSAGSNSNVTFVSGINSLTLGSRGYVGRLEGDSFCVPVAASSIFGIGNRLIHAAALTYDSASNTITIAGDTTTPSPASEHNLFFARFNANTGNLDYSFSFDGLSFVPLCDSATINNLILSDNTRKPVAAGQSADPSISGSSKQACLFRINTDGTVDNTFSGNGIANSAYNEEYSEFFDLIEQPDGKLIAVGMSYSATTKENILIVRFNQDGSVDQSFSDAARNLDITGGKDVATAVKLLYDGRIVVTGYFNNGSNTDMFVFVLNQDGTFDNTFSGDGKALIDFDASYDQALSILLPDTNTIIVGGTSDQFSSKGDYALAALNYKSLGAAVNVEKLDLLRVNLYPNPASDKISVDLESITSAAIRIVSISGQLVIARDLVQNHSTIDLMGLSPGMYFAQINLGDRVSNVKFVKQ